VNAANPVLADGQMFLSTGYGKGGGLFKIGSGGAEQVWKTKALRTQMNAAVLHGKHLYGVDGDTTEKASLKCVDFATGKEVWSEPGFGSGGVIVADGKLIALSAMGEIVIATATPEGFQPATRAQALAPKCWTAPVLANGFVYCRNQKGQIAVLDLRVR
jgi:outer membrane protein assembly factor BamB